MPHRSPHPDLNGLSEAEAARRLAEHGPNRLSERRTRRLWRIVLDAFREPMFLLLFAAVALYFALGDMGEALFLLAGSAATVGLMILQEARSERALAALRKLAEPTARVMRDGVERRIPAAGIVPGDVLLVAEGGRAPADAVLRAGDVLTVDESILTGEAAPVVKHPAADGAPDNPQGTADSACLFAGTLIVRGQGVAVVTRTGRTTRMGEIGASLMTLQESPTPLQQATRRVVRTLGLFAVLVAVGVLLIQGLARQDWVAGALGALTVGIALIPEEFPMVLAVFLALGGWRLAQKNVLVRRSAAIETLGAISVLCVDKTGTLTRNHMRLAALWRDGREWNCAAGAPADRTARELLHVTLLASAVHGMDPMDNAVHELAGDLWAHEASPLRSYPLRPDRLAFIQAWQEAEGVLFAAKGAPEAVFDLCGLKGAARTHLERAVADLAARGLRVLGVASNRCDHDGGREPPDGGFAFEGLAAFEDPVREEVPVALAAAQAAGVRVVMITGDYPDTGLAIAGRAGIDVTGGALSGAEVAALSPAALAEAVRNVSVFARISPDQKLRLVEAFRANGELVGMFGDGVNDAPALEAAHVGVAMGRRGTDVAREAADLVLLDDRFASIVPGIAEGRRIFANLRVALAYLVVVHVPMAGLALLPLLFGLSPVLFPMQVVLLELVIDPMCALVFEGRPAARGAMRHPPRRADAPLFGARSLLVSAAQGAGLLGAVFGLHLFLLSAGVPEGAARAAGLISLVAGNLGVAGVLSIAPGAGRSPAQRLAFAGIAVLAATTLAAGVAVPWLARLFQFETPTPLVALAALAAGLAAGLAMGMAALLHEGRFVRRATT
ncbi:cation-translocating P-type ATPase [Phenylobacterium sp.]|uniref:cation-translocating P-type ATPase n=1 Tax=Phenylobacterium sp. TaxID=1871053 RepID=UPI00395249D4